MSRHLLRSAFFGLAAMMIASSAPVLASDFKWGAYFVDTQDGTKEPAYGIGGGDSEQEAIDNAKKFCEEAGGTACTQAMTYEQCGALATDGKKITWGKAPTKEEAEAGAKNACGSDACEVVTSDCNAE